MGGLSTPVVGAIFLVATAATWFAGLYLADSTDVLDDRFHLGEAIGGLILLGIAGTLPEIAITASAAIRGNLSIAVGNLLGGIAMQTLVLVLMDLTSRSKTPLSSMSRVLEPIIEAEFVVLLVSIALLGPLLPPDVALGPIPAWRPRPTVQRARFAAADARSGENRRKSLTAPTRPGGSRPVAVATRSGGGGI